MAFHLDVRPDQELAISDIVYRVTPHPALAEFAYIQEGRQGWVCQLMDTQGQLYALKVFKPTYCVPSLVSLAEELAEYAGLPGLRACRRDVLTPEQHKGLLKIYPDLLYAVLMPWIEGPTWMEVVQEARDIPAERSLTLAIAFAGVLSRMEQKKLAHCDLSGPNVLLPEMAGGRGIALVDVEDMHAPNLHSPGHLPGGSLGYGHKTAQQGLWSAEADRFAGAVVLAEMLGWADSRIPAAAFCRDGAPESYFDPQEVQKNSERYRLLVQVLKERWGIEIAGMFERAWQSNYLLECPTFGEWLLKLPDQAPALMVEPSAPLELDSQLPGNPSMEGEKKEHLPEVDSVPVEAHERVLTEPAADIVDEDSLFIQALEAYDQSDWRKAEELLTAVELESPGYERQGKKAATLLQMVKDQLRKTGVLSVRQIVRQSLIGGLALTLPQLGETLWWSFLRVSYNNSPIWSGINESHPFLNFKTFPVLIFILWFLGGGLAGWVVGGALDRKRQRFLFALVSGLSIVGGYGVWRLLLVYFSWGRGEILVCFALIGFLWFGSSLFFKKMRQPIGTSLMAVSEAIVFTVFLLVFIGPLMVSIVDIWGMFIVFWLAGAIFVAGMVWGKSGRCVRKIVGVGISLLCLAAGGSVLGLWQGDEFFNVKEPGWTIISNLPSRWNFTARPGYLRIIADEGDFYQTTNDVVNVFVRYVPDNSFDVQLKLDSQSYKNYQQAGIIVYCDWDRYVRLTKAFINENRLELSKEDSAGFWRVQEGSFPDGPVYLRMIRAGSNYWGFFSSDGLIWMPMPDNRTLSCSPGYIGLVAFGGVFTADFDYFSYRPVLSFVKP